jgi:prephenate dehydratase
MSGAPVRVAFQGEHGAFSEEAARARFGAAAVTCPQRDFGDAAQAVRSAAVDYAVLPAENVIHGSVMPVYDLLAEGGLTIVDEVVHPIRLCLLGVPGARIDDVTSVLSHPVALNQCRRFLAAHPQMDAVAFFDTAGAAREVARRGDVGTAAIAPAGAGVRYGLDMLAPSVGDRPDNQTRFFVITRAGGGSPAETVPASEPCRTVLMVDAAHRPGSLLRVLAPLAERGINLTRIESRPARAAWTYHFFVEATAPARSTLEDALAAIGSAADRVVVLGVMPPARQAPQ